MIQIVIQACTAELTQTGLIRQNALSLKQNSNFVITIMSVKTTSSVGTQMKITEKITGLKLVFQFIVNQREQSLDGIQKARMSLLLKTLNKMENTVKVASLILIASLEQDAPR